MTDGRNLHISAKRLVSDETFNQAADSVSAVLIKALLTAATPEDRESKFQEYHALNRVRETLKKLAIEADK